MAELLDVLREKLMPWCEAGASQRFIMARHKMVKRDMPADVQLVGLRGQERIIPRKRQAYMILPHVRAIYPEFGLQELDRHQIVCVLDGHMKYRVGNYTVRCGPGHFLFIPPGIANPDGTRTFVDLEKSSTCEIITFLVHPRAIDCWMSHGHERGRERYNNCLLPEEHLNAILRAFLQEVHEGGAEAVAERLLWVFMFLMQRELENGQARLVQQQDPKLAKMVAPQDPFQISLAALVEQYVDANLEKPLTLQSVASALNMSHRTLARKLRRDTGGTFRDLLHKRRLKMARELLQDSTWSVAAISVRLGFASPTYFATFYKQHTKLTPSQARSTGWMAPPYASKVGKRW